MPDNRHKMTAEEKTRLWRSLYAVKHETMMNDADLTDYMKTYHDERFRFPTRREQRVYYDDAE